MNDLSAYWMSFTANRQFKKNPRMVAGADRMHFHLDDGRKLLDGIAGLWCCYAGHNRPRIVDAIQKRATKLDYSPAFQMGHHKAFELAGRLAKLAPGNLNRIFFTNSGPESVETALKVALAYHRARGEAHRTQLRFDCWYRTGRYLWAGSRPFLYKTKNGYITLANRHPRWCGA